MPRTVRTARAPTDLKPNLIRIKKRNDERADRRKGGERVKEFQQLGTSDQVFGRPRTGCVAHTILTDAALMMRATGRVARAELDEMRPILVTRASTARIRRRPPQTRNGAALATPSYSLVPPGGFENSPRGEIGDAGVDGPNPALRPEEPGTVVVPGSVNLWCPRADSNRRHPL